ncbi:hypothetical protein [Thalassospira sp. CH_XMU1420-2]|uniref:hypothetical protein n=1 Tax=Thalassospira sp. CH_XMU1420-2 TaxID=3107769 RepID=UPI00300A81AB|tara:strand:+ start:16690 stop:16995 length:306 start_codon:yes stop_codon:yes gene_type:complete
MKVYISAFLGPIHAAPGGDLCLPIVGLERARLVLKDPHGQVLQEIPNHGQPWDYERLVALEHTLTVPKQRSADLFLGDQMIGSTDVTTARMNMPKESETGQ